MARHTPIPWAISGFDKTTVIVVQDGPDRDGREYRDGRHQYTITRSGDVPDIYEQAANAAFIVKAVNCHDELVSALKEAETWLEVEFEGDEEQQGHMSVLNTVRAALAKARPDHDTGEEG